MSHWISSLVSYLYLNYDKVRRILRGPAKLVTQSQVFLNNHATFKNQINYQTFPYGAVMLILNKF